MASVFSHIAIPVALKISAGRTISWRLLLFAFFMSVAPDLDSIGFHMGVPYESQWGHRGFTHSIFFAAVFSILPALFYKWFRTNRLNAYFVSFISMMSHGILDACTTGGLGIAFLWPFNLERYFFPWQVIRVSPIGIREFFSQRGLVVLTSELYYVWIPCITLGIAGFLFRRKFGVAK